ncbi:MAG: type II toxin-antitoxin system VapC family toxin [Myxococcota bacterium]|nr:type II toxin-antitoxin system VapC family toxin [Myxococcota bacterium]
MIALDTNVLVRIVVDDDPTQARKARAMLAREQGFVSVTVLLESEWVLRGAYELAPAAILTVFERLLRVRGIDVEDRARVERAVAWYADGLDFADALHLAGAPTASSFATFDRKLARRAARLTGAPPITHP